MIEYAYDTRGNIISEKRGNLTTTYAYDALGQLIRVNDPHENATWVYSYDRGGNILSKAKYAYTTGTVGTALETIPYTYGDANWKDKLTAYNGTAITYDAIGNPLNDGAWTFTWAAGRQLKKMVREDRTLDFKYDHNGMRIQKVLQHDWYPETTNYTYHGKLLTHMTVDYHDWDEVAQQDKLHFFYDAQSRPVKISYNGVIYTYVHNLQGDIVGILDSTGALVVEYKYDAWGKLLATTGSLADTLGKRNPFRYRGYVYDEESELYYLRSRYYNPLIGRFVNADVYIAVQTDISSHNLYSYCKNQCINCADTNGMFVFIITSGLEDALLSSEAQYEEISDAYGCNCVHAIVVGGVIPMTGTPNGYASGYNGSGELYEGWYDSDGNIIRVRHHSNHKNPKTHPKNPHDHRGKKDANGKPTIDHKGEDPDPNYKAPTADKNSNSAKTALAGVGVTGGSYLVYKVIKLIVGIIAAPSTGGASLIPAIAP